MSEEVLIYGLHAVQSILDRDPKRVLQLVLQRGREDARLGQLLAKAKEHGLRVEHRDAKELDHLAGGGRHQGACARIRPTGALGEGALDELLDKTPIPFLLVLDGVQDPHNLGACLRTADAAGVSAVVVPRDRAVGLTPVVRKVASGAAETMPLIQVTNLARTLKLLKEHEIWVIGTDEMGTKSLFAADLKGRLALVMGAEGEGLRRLTQENCDLLVNIPMLGAVPSLNVSVAAGIALFEAVRQRGSKA
jgi:23S rRNA (guanosine2251-2'-O)-methyltransferase